MSASRCFSAWNEPIGRSYWRRTFAYSSVSSKMRRHAPAVASASATVATSSARVTARSTSGPGASSTRSAGTTTPSSARSASASVGSRIVLGSAFTASLGTRKTPSPPSPRATTAISSALAPSKTPRLASGEREAVARAPRAARDAAELPAVVLRERDGAGEASRRDALEPLVRERRGARLLEQRRVVGRGREEGPRRDGAAQLLGHEAQLDRAEPEPALRLRDRDARPRERHHLPPERRARLAALVRRARQRRRALLLEHAPHAVPQLRCSSDSSRSIGAGR